MDGFMPSEIARLVLGCLKETGCLGAWKAFLYESPDLREYAHFYDRGREYCTRINGQSLLEILENHSRVSKACMLMPSEIARLILGYLKESRCTESWKTFLHESPDLREYAYCYERGKEYSTRINGKSLLEMLEQYTGKNCSYSDSSEQPLCRCSHSCSGVVYPTRIVPSTQQSHANPNAFNGETNSDRTSMLMAVPKTQEKQQTKQAQREGFHHSSNNIGSNCNTNLRESVESHSSNSGTDVLPCHSGDEEPMDFAPTQERQSNDNNKTNRLRDMILCDENTKDRSMWLKEKSKTKALSITHLTDKNPHDSGDTSQQGTIVQEDQANAGNKRHFDSINRLSQLHSGSQLDVSNDSTNTNKEKNVENTEHRIQGPANSQEIDLQVNHDRRLPDNSGNSSSSQNPGPCSKNVPNAYRNFHKVLSNTSQNKDAGENAQMLNIICPSTATISPKPTPTLVTASPHKLSLFSSPIKETYLMDEDSRSPRRKNQQPRRRIPSATSPPADNHAATDSCIILEDSVDFGMFLEELINYSPFHEKMAEKINKAVHSDKDKGTNGESQCQEPDKAASIHKLHVPDNVIKDLASTASEEVFSLLCEKYDSSRDSCDYIPQEGCEPMHFNLFNHDSHYPAMDDQHDRESTHSSATPVLPENTPHSNANSVQVQAISPYTNSQASDAKKDMLKDNNNQVESATTTAMSSSMACNSTQDPVNNPAIFPTSTASSVNKSLACQTHEAPNRLASYHDASTATSPSLTLAINSSQSCPTTSVISTTQPASSVENVTLPGVALDGFLSLNANGMPTDFTTTGIPSNIVFSSIGNIPAPGSVVVGPAMTPVKLTVPDFHFLTLSPSQIYGMPPAIPIETVRHKPLLLPKPPRTDLVTTSLAPLIGPPVIQNAQPTSNQVSAAVSVHEAIQHPDFPVAKKPRLKSLNVNEIFSQPVVMRKLFQNKQSPLIRSNSSCISEQRSTGNDACGPSRNAPKADVASSKTSIAPPPSGTCQSVRSAQLQSLVNSACVLATKKKDKESHVRVLHFGDDDEPKGNAQKPTGENQIPEKVSEQNQCSPDGQIIMQATPDNETVKKFSTPTQTVGQSGTKKSNDKSCDVRRTLVCLANGGLGLPSPSPPSVNGLGEKATLPHKSGLGKRKRTYSRKMDLKKLDVNKFLDKLHSNNKKS